MLSFDNQRGIGVRTDTTLLSLKRGFGVHQLVLQLEVRARGFDTPTACVLEAELTTAGDYRWITSAAPMHLILTGDTSHQTQLPLSNDQLILLEEFRSGGDLMLALQLSATIFPQSGPPLPTNGSLHLRIPASVWQDATDRLNTAVSFTMTVPLPSAEGAHREAAEHLRMARRLLNEGKFDKAIGSARKVMEIVGEAAGWQRRAITGPVRDADQKQRWEAIYKAAFDQASGADHADGIARDFIYSRGEAEALIGIATSLLKAIAGPIY